MKNLTAEKLDQAHGILNELDLDVWIIFVRERRRVSLMVVRLGSLAIGSPGSPSETLGPETTASSRLFDRK